MAKSLELFPITRRSPLADRLRPQRWADFQGVEALDPNLLRRLQAGEGVCPSLVIWGPPGSGKTTLARLLGSTFKCRFVAFSAVLGGVKDLRQIVAEAQQFSEPTLLFVDEIHRFNKGQQDAFLPHVEDGTIVLVGATTENPSFYLNSALLSRLGVLTLPALSEEALGCIAAAARPELELELEPEALALLCRQAGGDARRLLNTLENLKAALGAAPERVELKVVQAFLKDGGAFRYDRAGEEHYNIASAFIKSLRGSHPEAALYWGFRMVAAGEDPRFVLRRLIIFASEDIGNADPRALQVAVTAAEAYDRVGMPEGRIVLGHCITFLAAAPKSNRSYLATEQALAAVKDFPAAEVPLHLRNAPTDLMKDLGYSKGYQYPHDYDGAYVPGVSYLPEQVQGQVCYEPSDRGHEKSIKERLERWRSGGAKGSGV